MRTYSYLLLCVLALLSAKRAFGADPKDGALPKGNAYQIAQPKFAAKLYGAARAERSERNIAVSPLSAFESLVILRGGAGGSTRVAIGEILGVKGDDNASLGVASLRALGASAGYFFPGFVLDNRRFGVRVAADLAAGTKAEGTLQRDDLIFTVNSIPVRDTNGFRAICETGDGVIEVDGYDFSTGMPFSKLQIALEKKRGDLPLKHKAVLTASAFWLSDSIARQSDFAERISERFGTKVFPTERFSSKQITQEASQYFREKTAGRLPSIQIANVAAETRFLLIQAAALDAKWRYAFDPKKTESGDFLAPSGPMKASFMQDVLPLRIAEMPSYRVAELPLWGGDLSVLLCLPNEPDGWKDVEERWMKSHDVQAVRKRLTRQEVHVRLPRFRVESDETLNEIYSTLGLTMLFSSQADFTGIAPNGGLKLGEVRQRTFVEIDESGVRAGAVTQSVGVAKSPSTSEPVAFHLTHPFLFQIVDATGPVFFCGRVTQPTTASETVR